MNSEINFKIEIDKTTVRLLVIVAALIALIVVGAHSVGAQEVADTIKINTRVVFMDALVKDKRTGVPIADLKPEHFEIFDDGVARPVSYFTREGQARKPLALVLILDLRDDGAGRFLKRPEILKAMADELAKLSPEDEVAILAIDISGEDEKRVWLTDFTRDRAQLVAALSRAPQYVDVDPDVDVDLDKDEKAARSKEVKKPEQDASLTIGSGASGTADAAQPVAGSAQKETSSAGPGPGTPLSDQDLKVEVIKGKDGHIVTRTTHPDGSVDIKRQNKKGDITMEVHSVYDMAAAVRDTIGKTQKDRPNSQASIVWVSDGIAPIFLEDREATEQLVLRSNVIFNSLTVELRTLFKFLMPIAKPVGGMLGVSVYGSAKRLAERSGGEAVKVKRTKDYAAGLSKIIGNLTARYSLGFSLEETEKDDGHLHNLDVRVKAPDAKGKLRKLEVSARRGYYMTETPEKDAKEATAAKTQ